MFEKSHWFLCILDNSRKRLTILDPYLDVPETYTNLTNKAKIEMQVREFTQKKHLETLKLIKEEFLMAKNISTGSCQNQKIELKVMLPPDLPLQSNPFDCGVFLMEFAKYACLNIKPDFNCSDMPRFRIQIKEELLAQKLIIPRSKNKENAKYSIKESNLILLAFNNPPCRNLCFSNTVTSSLLNIPLLRQFLSSNKNGNVKLDRSQISKELISLNSLKKFSKASTLRLRSIIKSVCYSSGQTSRNFSDNKQHDSGEFLISIFEHLFNEPIFPEHYEEVIFGGLFKETLECKCGNVKELRIQKLPPVLPIALHGTSIESCLTDFLSPQQINMKCEKCSKQETMKHFQFIVEPSTLILQLNRFSFQTLTGITTKRQDPISFPKSLVLPSGTTYKISCIINHIGDSPSAGHYNLLINDECNDVYILLDDLQIIYDVKIDEEMSQLPYIAFYIKNS